MKILLAAVALTAATSSASLAVGAECHTAGSGGPATATACVHLRQYCQAHWDVEEDVIGADELDGSVCVPPPTG